MPGEELHHQRAGMPAAGDDPAIGAARCRRLVDMHRLRVVAAGKLDDLVFADRNRAAGHHPPDRIVLEIPVVATHPRISGKSMMRASALAVSSTAQLSRRPLLWSRASPAEPGL